MSYLLVAWQGDDVPPSWVDALIAALPGDWRTQMAAANVLVARGGRHEPPLRIQSDCFLIGEVFGGPSAREARGGQDADRARRLCHQSWGSYVALLVGEAGSHSVFRDPSGGLDCLAWSIGTATLVADDLPAWLDPWLPAELAIDWDYVAAMLCDPASAFGDVALKGVEGIAPGALWSPAHGRQAIWTPARAARGARVSRAQALAVLPDLVDEVVGALAGAHTLIELSGGLDSAIVASALRANEKSAEGLNYFTKEPGGDERSYARAVAHLNGLKLTEVEKPAPSLDLAGLASASCAARPGFNALDVEHDQDVAQRCLSQGFDALLTGQGGDHVFFQAPSALIAADAIGRGLGPGMLQVLSRRLGRSAWSILAEALGARLGGEPLKGKPAHVSLRAWAAAASPRVHPWLEDLRGLAPAKALQAACLGAAIGLQGASRRGEAARLRHPLLSQPIMEFCLPIAVADLTLGGHDRALARNAFASRLPGCVVERRGKGRLTSHYGRSIASGLAHLRPLLLEGRLAQAGLLDLEVVDLMLSYEHLAWRGGYGAIMSMTALELWVRSWEARMGRPLAAPQAH